MDRPTCATCRWWLKNDGMPGGTCELAYFGGDPRQGIKCVVPSFAVGNQFFAAAAGRMGHLHCGPAFSCIHHEPNFNVEAKQLDTDDGMDIDMNPWAGDDV